jgi:S1-C subfamily serine protease
VNFVDVLIVIFALSALLRGRELGFVRQLFSSVGFFTGLFLGALLQPHLVQNLTSPLSRSLLTILLTLGCGILLLAVGEYVGIHAKRRLQIWKINRVDNFFGSILGVVSILLIFWLSAAILSIMPYTRLQDSLHQSAILRQLDRTLPSAPTIVANLGHLIDPNGFPRVFIGEAPGPPQHIPQPSLGDFQMAVDRARPSVVKVQGQGCGGIVQGSGFVVGSNLVATNAHVVAGIARPFVVDGNGTHTAQVIWFDPNLDFAVLRVNNLAGNALVFSSQHVSRGTPAVVLGFPGGGGFVADPAAVLDEFTATGRNIYNKGATERDVYEIGADIIPGNSGGPLLLVDGTVIGVIFAESTDYEDVGYALSNDQVVSAIRHARTQNRIVSTGSCAR